MRKELVRSYDEAVGELDGMVARIRARLLD